MKKLLILLIFCVSAFSADFAVIEMSADDVFNFFFSLVAVPALIMAGFSLAISIFRF